MCRWIKGHLSRMAVSGIKTSESREHHTNNDRTSIQESESIIGLSTRKLGYCHRTVSVLRCCLVGRAYNHIWDPLSEDSPVLTKNKTQEYIHHIMCGLSYQEIK